MIFIYVLELENNKYYIGKTNYPKFRLDSHFNYRGSEWTKKYKPIKLKELIKNCESYDEDKYVIKYMEKFGIDNVRGGSFCQIKLGPENKKIIKRMINSSNDKCFKCKSNNHFASKCTYEKSIGYEDNSTSSEENSTSYEDNSINDDEIYIWECEFCGREFKTEKGCSIHEKIYCGNRKSNNCYRCGRQGHYANNCFANKHIKGYYLY